jgi:glycosyltransferase involved in cell wall biosynthesis
MPNDPLVTIVTPSLNMARFIEQTICSVLDQDYPRIEYIIVDGGSTDGTPEIVSKYRDRLSFRSGPDNGQADAVNKGFRLAHGEIFSFLNADDIYRPGAISAVVDAFRRFPEAAVVYGEADWIDDQGHLIGRYPTAAWDPLRLGEECFICQPAAFLRSHAFSNLGGVNPRLSFALDYDLWIRASSRCSFIKIDTVLAASRMHPSNKTLGQRRHSFREALLVLRSHYGYVPLDMVYGFCDALLSGRDLFLQKTNPSRLASLLSIPVGLYYNRSHPFRFAARILRGMRKKSRCKRR